MNLQNKCMKQFLFLATLSWMLIQPAWAQFTPLGNATQTSNACYTLTQNQPGQGGAIWNAQTIDLTRPFDLVGQLFLGCANGGADGIVFVMSDGPVALGTTGAGMGYATLPGQSVAVEFDTWQNTWLNDPPGDHVAIISNGVNNHAAPANLAGPVAILPTLGDVETCTFRNFRITWDPVGDSLTVWVNCSQRINYVGDIVNNIFGGNSIVKWGFTSSTGAAGNLHQVCVNYFNNYRPQTICYPDTVALNAGPGTNSGLTTTYSWAPASNVSNPTIRNPQVFPDTTSTFSVTVNDGCGLARNRSWEFTVVYDTVLNVSLGPDTTLCDGQGVALDVFRPGADDYLWMDGVTDSVRFLTQPDTYWVELSNLCGVRRDTKVVSIEGTPDIFIGNDTSVCMGDTLPLDATGPNATYLWQDNSTAPTFDVTGPGIYNVRVDNICGVDRDTILVTYVSPPLDFSLGGDTVLCNAATWSIDVSHPSATSYLWQDGSTAPTFDVQTPGVFHVQRINKCGFSADTVLVDYDLTPTVDLGPDTTLCAGTPYLRNVAFSSYTTYQWQDNSTSPTYTIITGGQYSVTLTNDCGTASDNLVVTYLQPPVDPDIGPDTILCGNATITLNSGLTGYDFQWQDGSMEPTFFVNEEGTYVLTVTNRCGSQQDSAVVRYETIPDIDLGNDTTLCEGQTILLNALFSRSTYVWENGFTGPFRDISEDGRYEVTVTNLCGEDRDVINVEVLPYPDDVNLGGDQTLCTGDSLLLDATQPGFAYLWQNGSSDPAYLVRFAGTYSVRVGNACGEEVDQVTINYVPVPTLELGEDPTLCIGEVIRVDGTSSTPGVRYAWENGSTSPVRTISEPGSYSLTVSNGCDAVSDSILVIGRECNCLVHIPSGFTPNDDGINDEFFWAFSCDLQQARLRIFDRWGALVFESGDPAAGWNGQLPNGRNAPEGVYVWALDYTFFGVTEAEVEDQKSGTVTLLR